MYYFITQRDTHVPTKMYTHSIESRSEDTCTIEEGSDCLVYCTCALSLINLIQPGHGINNPCDLTCGLTGQRLVTLHQTACTTPPVSLVLCDSWLSRVITDTTTSSIGTVSLTCL